MQWAEKRGRKEDFVLPYLKNMEKQNRYGVYFIFQSMEQGATFRSTAPRFPVEDPDYRILAQQRSLSGDNYFSLFSEFLLDVTHCTTSLSAMPPRSSSKLASTTSATAICVGGGTIDRKSVV